MDGRGARQDEAEEIVLPEFILLKPEPKGKTPEEKRLEREYQEIYGTPRQHPGSKLRDKRRRCLGFRWSDDQIPGQRGGDQGIEDHRG